MVVVGAVIYASGQVMGAETRGRANVWATAALVGAVMSVLINTIAPPVMGTAYGTTMHADCSFECKGLYGATPMCFIVPAGGGCCARNNQLWVCPPNASRCDPNWAKCCNATACYINGITTSLCSV